MAKKSTQREPSLSESTAERKKITFMRVLNDLTKNLALDPTEPTSTYRKKLLHTSDDPGTTTARQSIAASMRQASVCRWRVVTVKYVHYDANVYTHRPWRVPSPPLILRLA